MSKARLEWLETVARMDRAELVDAYEIEGNRAHEATQKLTSFEQEIKRLKAENSGLKDQRERDIVLIAESLLAAKGAAERMSLNPKRVTLLTTSNTDFDKTLRGMRLDPSTVFFVRGWKRGRYAEQMLSALWPSLRRADGTPVGVDAIPYAPDPHFDMHEDDKWESATRALRAQHEWLQGKRVLSPVL